MNDRSFVPIHSLTSAFDDLNVPAQLLKNALTGYMADSTEAAARPLFAVILSELLEATRHDF